MDDDTFDSPEMHRRSDGGRDSSGGRTYYATHDVYGPRSVSTTIVRHLAEIADEEVTRLGFSLYDHIDTDSLDGLFESRSGIDPPFDGHVSFSVARYRVTVHGTGDIEIVAPDGD